MNEPDLLQLYNQFNRIHNQFTAVKRSMIKTIDNQNIYPAEMQVLALLNLKKSYTVTDIAKELYMTKSGASQIVKKLSLKGFITKKRPRDNERTVTLQMTKKGETIVHDFLNSETNALGEMIQDLSQLESRDIDTIKLFLNKLEKMFDKKLG